MKYYKHKEKEVYCCVVGNLATFSKWKWKGDTCVEEKTSKEVTDAFKIAFEECTKVDYNNDWGIKLEKA